MNIKERIRKMGPFIALVVTFIVIAALNDSFVAVSYTHLTLPTT